MNAARRLLLLLFCLGWALPAFAADVTITQGAGGANLTIAGGSSGVSEFDMNFPAASLEPLEAADSIPPLTKTTGTNIDEFSISYDATTDEGRKMTFVVPTITGLTNATWSIYWWSATATTNAAVFDIRYTSTGADGESWDQTLTTASSTCTVAGTVKQFDVCQITVSLATLGWAAGDRVTIMLYRDANNGSDTLVGDAEVSNVHLKLN